MSDKPIKLAVWGNVPFQRNMLIKSGLSKLPYEVIDLNQEYAGGDTLDDRKLPDLCRKLQPDILFFGLAGVGYEEPSKDRPAGFDILTHWDLEEGYKAMMPQLRPLTRVICYGPAPAFAGRATALGAEHFLDLLKAATQLPSLIEQVMAAR